MKIVALNAYQVRIPLRRRIRHAAHTRTETDNVLVRCALEDGSVGFGEGVPRDYVTGETIDSAFDLLRRSDLAGQREECRDFEQAVALAERLQLASVPGDERGCEGNAARCAIELAILDAYGQSFRRSLSDVVRLLAPEIYQPQPRVRYSGAITTARGIKTLTAAIVFRIYRFRQVKIKVGMEGYNDRRRLSVVRRWGGHKIDIRLDANEAWTPANVVERIRALESYGISAVEQPVPHADAAVLRDVRRQVRTPIMLDESLCSRFDAERAVEGQICDLFNLRLSKCGGFIPSLRLAQFAKQKGLGCQLGCQVGETAVLSAAGRHFASSVAGLRYLEGSYDRHLVREALATEDLTFGWGGWAKALPGPGLGIALDPQALQRVTIREETLFS
ncbi:MAG TPA: dipeptide epimerase [Gemmataceae bacterium]|nr:dipeptide epimerase [Gemmataceae bacterium]